MASPERRTSIKDADADRLARELAAETGETITNAITVAVRERLERLRGRVPRDGREQAIRDVGRRAAARTVRDDRAPDEILGYDDDGLPG